ncbi:hypothetical protein ACHAXR_005073 [Thalassiosira sp. AJA248-18]
MTVSSDNPTLNEPFNNAHFESLPHVPCVSLFHRTGRVGCGTWSRNVMTGRLLDWSSVASNTNDNVEGGASVVPPYVAVMDEEYYTDENIANLMLYSQQYAAGEDYGEVDEGGPLRGLLVLASDNNNNVASPEPLAPQGDDTPSSSITIGSSYEWNVNNAGNGLTTTDMYGLPTAYIADANTAAYLKSVASEQGNISGGDDASATVYPSIVSEFNYYMGPGGEVDADNGEAMYNSKKCLEWKDNDGEWSPRCAPLGGNSVWAVAGTPISLGYSNGGEDDANENNGNADNGGENDSSSNKPVILVTASIDSTSMFHDLSPGANNAASNILTLLMAAQLIGSSIKDEALDELYGQIAFAFFQGESYGYIGSRRFLKDVMEGFECSGGNEGVASVYKAKDESGDTTTRACLHPPRADLTFQNLGEVRGMIAVDQVGNLGGTKNLYVQGGEDTDGGNGFASFLSEVMVELSASDDGGYTAQASSVEEDDGTSPLPPTPLSSLVSLSSAAVGGVVLTGYDDAFVANSLYHSHLDSTSKYSTIDKDAIASAATLVARSAVAAAYQNANDEVDSATASAYALDLLPTAVDSSSETFAKLYNCLFEDGNCETFLTYGGVERANDAVKTGIDLGMGVPLGTPPSYYTSIYDSSNGQAFVYASGKYYGSLIGGEKDKDGEVIKNYGDDGKDAFLVRPSLLEMAIFGLLNDFLGRGAIEMNDDGSAPALATCKSSSDCSSVSYCNSESSAVVLPACAGGSCVCGSRSHYHLALDEALSAAANVGTSRFEIQDGEEGISALYTEPYWSSYVGVRIYNDAGNTPGVYASSIGAVFALACIGFVLRLKKTMVKQKVY